MSLVDVVARVLLVVVVYNCEAELNDTAIIINLIFYQ